LLVEVSVGDDRGADGGVPPSSTAPITVPASAASNVDAASHHRIQIRHSLDPVTDKTPSQLIDERIKQLDDWRGETLARLRDLVKEADPDVVEEWKWRGVPTWYHDGILFTGETYKSIVKMTFAKGASLKDPSGLFNSSLEGNVRRAIDFHEGEKMNEKALMALMRAAVALNASKSKK
jgi:hypothetical protein